VTGGFRDRLQVLAAIEPSHFWFAGRRTLVERLLRRLGPGAGLALDAGCGTGALLEALAGHGWQPVGVDLLAGRTVAQASACADPERRRKPAPLVRASAEQLPFADAVFAGALLLDVLEHADDARVLASVHRVLKPAGWALIAVPAMPWMWSHRDLAAGHLRRYTRRSLRAVLAGAGFDVVEMRYYQCLLFPIVVLTRWLGRGGPAWRDREDRPPRWLNALLRGVNRVEARLSDAIPWPWGSSLFAMGRKR
jgi:SAM-dependent methyltransferase